MHNIPHNLTVLQLSKLIFNNLGHLACLLLSFIMHKNIEFFRANLLTLILRNKFKDSSFFRLTELWHWRRLNTPVLISVRREQQVRQTTVNSLDLSSCHTNKSFTTQRIHTFKNFRRVDTFVLTKSVQPLLFNSLTCTVRSVKRFTNKRSQTLRRFRRTFGIFCTGIFIYLHTVRNFRQEVLYIFVFNRIDYSSRTEKIFFSHDF